MKTLEEQTQIIQAAGYRFTQSRLAVLTVLAQVEESLDTATVYELGRQIHPTLGRVSVYRALDLLTRLGLVRLVHGEKGCRAYARAERTEGHYLICQRCHQVIEFPCAGLDDLLEGVGRQFDYLIQGHMLQLEGLCATCRPAV